MNVSELLIAIRAKLNLTQEQLAEQLNVSFATVNRWENDKRSPSKRYVYLIEEFTTIMLQIVHLIQQK